MQSESHPFLVGFRLLDQITQDDVTASRDLRRQWAGCQSQVELLLRLFPALTVKLTQAGHEDTLKVRVPAFQYSIPFNFVIGFIKLYVDITMEKCDHRMFSDRCMIIKCN